MKHLYTLRRGGLAVLFAASLSACESPKENAAPLGASPNQNDKKSSPEYGAADFAGPAGGSNTVNVSDEMALGTPSPALSGSELVSHIEGRKAFEQEFSLQQLAPLWNNEKCSGCHVNGGRSKLSASNPLIPQLLFRVSIPGTNDDGGPKPVPGFGDQIQPFIVEGGVRAVGAEGRVSITYVEQLRSFVDGQQYSLRTPTYAPTASLPSDVMVSPRIGSQVTGLGLLEAVEEHDIETLADPSDKNKDGISGRPNRVWDVALQKETLGRFGWKANQPNLLQQAAAAFNGDLGITSPFFPLESDAPGGGRNKKGPGKAMSSSGLGSLTAAAAMLHTTASSTAVTDINADFLFATAFYTGTLGVPAARNSSDPQVLAGQALFVAAKCASCHTPVLKTGAKAPFGLSNQTIHPYTDLLLHDMGPGLADGRPDFLATGSEWRTAPLWGTGLSATTSKHTFFLHDGRARNVMEAIMWHGGEGDASRRYVEQLSQTERDALVAFVNSL